MDRREAVKTVTILLGGAVTGANVFIAGCSPADAQINPMFKASEVALLDEIAETILPATSTPGAKDAKVGDFIALMVNECYTKDDQQHFKAGFEKFQQGCESVHGKKFMKCTPEQRLEYVTGIDKEAKEYMNAKKNKDKPHYFRWIKELTLLGFFTSEPGCTKAIRYVQVPGRYDACIPYKKGDRLMTNNN